MINVYNAFYLAWSDTKARYKKSVIGPFWLTLSNVFGILGLGFVWGHLLNQDMQNFMPQLTIGLIVWQLIAGVLTDGPSTFVRHAIMMRNVAMPSYFFAIRVLAKHLINFAHNIVLIAFVVIYYDVEMTQSLFLVLPGLLLVIVNLYWILHILGLAGARFRDIELLINSITPVLFFISPVLFRADKLPPAFNLVWLNPFSYMIEVVRSPLLGAAPSLITWCVLIVMCVVGSSVAWIYQRSLGRNLPFWV